MPCASFLLDTQRFEAGDDVEQLLVDAALAQTMECAVEVLQQVVDVLVGALHRRQAARVLAGESDSAQARKSETKRYSRMSARRVAVVCPMTSGRFPVGQGSPTQLPSPAFVEREQPLADGRIGRAGGRTVVEEVKLGDFALAMARLAFHEDLPDERRDAP